MVWQPLLLPLHTRHRCCCRPTYAGMPVGDRLRVFSGYAASYDTRLRNPRWVLEHISAATLKSGGGNRKNSNFVEDAGRSVRAGLRPEGARRLAAMGGVGENALRIQLPPVYPAHLHIARLPLVQASSAVSAPSWATSAGPATIGGTMPPLPTTRAARGPWTTHSPSPTRALRQGAGMGWGLGGFCCRAAPRSAALCRIAALRY